jgi:hypothetical protein
VTLNIPTDALFVPTDEQGRQFHDEEATFWSLPAPAADGTVAAGSVLEAAASGVKLLDLDALLDELGARIFVAESTSQGPALVAETAWSLQTASRFALDCAQHVLAGVAPAAPEVAGTLQDVVAAARKWLDRAADADTGLLGRYSRLGMARRLRRQGDQVAHLAFDLAIDDEVADVDLFDDPHWTAVAAVRDAVLAAVEAVRHDSAPRFTQAENTRYEEGEDTDHAPVSATFETPWGPFRAGLRKGALPAWEAATEAAERARQSAADSGGTAAAERAWQRDRLMQALRGS